MTSEELLVALVKLSPSERMDVLKYLPEFQKLTKPNELRSLVRREIVDQLIDLGVKAQEFYAPNEHPLRALVRAARNKSAAWRVEEKGETKG